MVGHLQEAEEPVEDVGYDVGARRPLNQPRFGRTEVRFTMSLAKTAARQSDRSSPHTALRPGLSYGYRTRPAQAH